MATLASGVSPEEALSVASGHPTRRDVELSGQKVHKFVQAALLLAKKMHLDNDELGTAAGILLAKEGLDPEAALVDYHNGLSYWKENP
jgi:hypothetical protein